jgi:hypothetical protein
MGNVGRIREICPLMARGRLSSGGLAAFPVPADHAHLLEFTLEAAPTHVQEFSGLTAVVPCALQGFENELFFDLVDIQGRFFWLAGAGRFSCREGLRPWGAPADPAWAGEIGGQVPGHDAATCAHDHAMLDGGA